MPKLTRWLAPALTVSALAPAAPAFADDPPACPACAKPATPPGKADVTKTVWPLTLREAIRVTMGNSEIVRVVGPGAVEGVTTVSRADPRVDPDRLRAEVMAEVRSVEQQYWSLAQQQAQLHATEKALETGEGVLKREQSELEIGRGTTANVAEALQRVEQFRLDLTTKTSDVLTSERQLRNLMGLPATDDRRIVPTTPPTEAQVTPDWDESLGAMQAFQPDLAQARRVLGGAAARCVEAALPCVLAELAGTGAPPDAVGRYEEASRALTRQRAFLKQVEHQTTHTLARFFLEIDANYKQFRTACRYKEAAGRRLEAQRAFYEEGRITIDRYLDAISQYASAVAQESQFKASYNISIIALEEAKGTLLAYDKVALTLDPTPAPAADDAVRTASFEPTPKTPAVPDAKPAADTPNAAGRTVDFHVTIGGANGVDVKGTFTVSPARSENP